MTHLYFHIPFCRHICPYCGFYKHHPGDLANRAFVDALLAEADRRTEETRPALETIYFGGGTPSLLSPALLERLCRGLAERFDLSALTEWTLEANPATFDRAKAALMRDLGVTRVSLGVQSFQPAILRTLGRDHGPEDAVTAYEALRAADFDAIGIDLMFSVPGQDRDLWQSDLDRAVALAPDHLSAYNLTYEEDTEFLSRHDRGELDADEDRDADLFFQAVDFLEIRGYRHYEISNYARPGHESRHNRAYWDGADYLGLGPGAVSTVDDTRWRTLPDTAAYVRAAHAGLDTRTEIESLTEADRRLEAIALQLRTREGIPERWIHSSNPLDSLIQQGLIARQADRLVLSRHGQALADPITAALL